MLLVKALLLLWLLTAFSPGVFPKGIGKRFRSSSAGESFNGTAGAEKRKGKLFSLFNVVTFRNGPCTSTQDVGSNSRNGTCLTSTECTDRSGTIAGNCAAGFGVCCVFILQTGTTTVTQNCTYIQNTGFPSALTDTSSLSFTVQKCSNDVCMLRLDFEMFTLVGTNGSSNDNEGDCVDSFTVTVPTGQIVPTICGENAGQHMYVDIGANAGDTATLAFAFSNAVTNVNRVFDIKVTQVECNNMNRPRDNCCLQYHTGCVGRIETFNFGNQNDNHLNNQQYSICIRQEEGFCCVQYMVCSDAREMLTNGQPRGFSFDTISGNSQANDVCVSSDNSRDYIAIPESGASCAPMGGDGCRQINSRYCGGNLNFAQAFNAHIQICDCTGPFNVDIFFNNIDDKGAAARNDGVIPTKHSQGLCLEYRQVRC